MASVIAASLVVFAITLTVNKSTLFATKREFVHKRYQSSFVEQMRPGLIHRLWHAWWTCPMCFGFWVSLVVVPFSPSYIFNKCGYLFDVLMVYGLNWLWHCLEDYLFKSRKQHESETSEE